MRYVQLTLTDGKRMLLRVIRESPLGISGFEVNTDGDEVRGTGGYHRKLHLIARSFIKKAVEMRMNPKYATLEVVHATRKTPAQLDADIAEVLGRWPR